MRLFEVKYFEPRKGRTPAQIRYANCWLESPTEKHPDATHLRMAGAEGKFAFVNGVCEKFLGQYRAQIVGEISSDRHMERDRFEETALTSAPF